MGAMASRHPRHYRRLRELLRQARRDAKLTQVEVAAMFKTSQQVISQIELGERRLDPVELLEFAECYGKDIRDFLPDSIR